MAPLSRSVLAAGQNALYRLQTPNQIRPSDFFDDANEVRQMFARLINEPNSNRVALIPSVSYGMSVVAHNTSLRPGQNVVIVSEQFPSNVYTWKRLCNKTEAELRTVMSPNNATDRTVAWNASIIDAIDEQTGLVAIPELHWTDGTRFNVEQIGARARACGATFVIDGTQSIGASPFDIQRVRPDALVCAGYKWLTGPYAAGVAYFGTAFDKGIPLEENWITRFGSDNFSGLVEYRDEYQPNAIRYDVGERSSFVLLPMLKAALTQVLKWGPAGIQDYCRTLTQKARLELGELGCGIQTAASHCHHLFGIRMPHGVNLADLSAELAEQDVSVSLRGTAVRVAPHLYNRPEDLDALVTAIRNVLRRSRTGHSPA